MSEEQPIPTPRTTAEAAKYLNDESSDWQHMANGMCLFSQKLELEVAHWQTIYEDIGSRFESLQSELTQKEQEKVDTCKKFFDRNLELTEENEKLKVFHISNWICVKHTDSERQTLTCPVCAKALQSERDHLRKACEALMKLVKGEFSTQAEVQDSLLLARAALNHSKSPTQ